MSDTTELKICQQVEATALPATVPCSMESTPLNEQSSTMSSTTFHTPTTSTSNLPKPVQTGAVILAEFTLYSKLPPELRFKIIQFAVKHFPRILQVRNYGTGDSRYEVVPTSITTLLQVNHEIRGEAMRYYTAPFHIRAKRGRYLTDLKVNWEIDTLYLQHVRMPWFHRMEALEALWEALFAASVTEMKQNLHKLAGPSSSGFWGVKFYHGFLGSLWRAERRLGNLSRLEVFDGFVQLEEVSAVCGVWGRKRKLLGFKDAPVKNSSFTKEDAKWLEKGINQNRGGKKVVVRVYNHVGASEQ